MNALVTVTSTANLLTGDKAAAAAQEEGLSVSDKMDQLDAW